MWLTLKLSTINKFTWVLTFLNHIQRTIHSFENRLIAKEATRPKSRAKFYS